MNKKYDLSALAATACFVAVLAVWRAHGVWIASLSLLALALTAFLADRPARATRDFWFNAGAALATAGIASLWFAACELNDLLALGAAMLFGTAALTWCFIRDTVRRTCSFGFGATVFVEFLATYWLIGSVFDLL